jgi:hypothetical protein
MDLLAVLAPALVQLIPTSWSNCDELLKPKKMGLVLCKHVRCTEARIDVLPGAELLNTKLRESEHKSDGCGLKWVEIFRVERRDGRGAIVEHSCDEIGAERAFVVVLTRHKILDQTVLVMSA